LFTDAISLRPATIDDAAVAHAWRNDARTLRHFRDPEPVSWDQHLGWWRRTLDDVQRRLLIARCGNKAVGSVRFDFTGDSAEISLYIDPELTGLGLGKAMLEASQRWITAQAPRINRVVAEVLPGNTASAGAFRAAGFSPASPQNWNWETRR
jgi:UDP-2,4-diacetamido-2,4,6-trideoxy-beta-L-altropyranose hydrolase